MVQRYVRLVSSSAALVLTIFCSVWARQWLQDDFIPLAPGWSQMAAHLTLLFGVLEIEPLSAGIWYVAIDFQLFAMMAIVLWWSRRQALLLVAPLMLASLFFFNSEAGNDNWAPYFFGAYAMGAFAWWAGHSPHRTRKLVMLATVGIAALVWEFRLRIALALMVALWLGYARSQMTRQKVTSKPLHSALIRLIRRSGRSSYALFLTHFSVLMLANVVWASMPWTFDAALVFTVCAWLACIALALLFERWVERPLSALGGLSRRECLRMFVNSVQQILLVTSMVLTCVMAASAQEVLPELDVKYADLQRNGGTLYRLDPHHLHRPNLRVPGWQSGHDGPQPCFIGTKILGLLL